MEPRELVKWIAETLDNKKGQDVRILEISDLTVMADYFVVVTGTSAIHLKTLSNEVEAVLKEQGVMPLHTEGKASGNWLLLDYGAVVVHIFLQETRSFYSIERIWQDARVWDMADL